MWRAVQGGFIGMECTTRLDHLRLSRWRLRAGSCPLGGNAILRDAGHDGVVAAAADELSEDALPALLDVSGNDR